ncbi:hypothetical protein HAX54_027438 [Datura stramonium]|uniref:MD-2-related lipid-recognition domain-containing protein n=1 Tax=Datura stramonium TaxID=4076 RepID=A0ABS8S8T9_DATST|nr:hypothetical protein [Datura stramonium]
MLLRSVEADITPYPVKGGKETNFSIAATTDENISGGKLVIDVKYLFLHVHQETHDICEETSCPVSGDFRISHSQALPGIPSFFVDSSDPFVIALFTGSSEFFKERYKVLIQLQQKVQHRRFFFLHQLCSASQFVDSCILVKLQYISLIATLIESLT